MDLSQIPLKVLQAEHDEVNSMQNPGEFGRRVTSICVRVDWCDECPLGLDVCRSLYDASPGWPERKERYLLELRAEIERRSACE